MPAFNNLRLLSVRSLTSNRYSIVFEGDTATYLENRDVIFKACINQGSYILEDGKVFFADKGENENKDDQLNKTFQLDKSNADL